MAIGAQQAGQQVGKRGVARSASSVAADARSDHSPIPSKNRQIARSLCVIDYLTYPPSEGS